MSHSYVVTGGGRGVGRAIVERPLVEEDTVVAIELEPSVLSWVENHPAASRIIPVIGNAADESVAEQAADRPQTAGSFSGWVNNAAVFHDTPIHRVPARQVLDGITLNLNLALVGCAVAYLLSDTASFINGAIVPVDGGRSVLGPDPEERDPTS